MMTAVSMGVPFLAVWRCGGLFDRDPLKEIAAADSVKLVTAIVTGP
jgi:hypothetical protein